MRVCITCCLLLLGNIVAAQYYSGTWKGAAHYKKGNLQIHDSITINIQNDERRVTGSIDRKIEGMPLEMSLYFKGEWDAATQLLSIFTDDSTIICPVAMKNVPPKPAVPRYQMVLNKDGQKETMNGPQVNKAATEQLVASELQLERVVSAGFAATPVADSQKMAVPGFEPRKTNVSQTIEADTNVVHIALYDNAEVDGDSVSVFLDDKLLFKHQLLSDKPLHFDVVLEADRPRYVLTMYADNLGRIPPNTALMVVTVRNKRYEVLLRSDRNQSAAIVFQPMH
jgi:hypothetical protein